jgi:hypothetical protein
LVHASFIEPSNRIPRSNTIADFAYSRRHLTLTWVREKHPHWHERLWRLDQRVSGFPVIRALSDYFLIVMRKRY